MAQPASKYCEVQAVGPGKLELVGKPLIDPLPGHVRIHVEACGVCHSDTATIEGVFPIEWPRVPGHEAVGRIDALGDGVEKDGQCDGQWASGSESTSLAAAADIVCPAGTAIS